MTQIRVLAVNGDGTSITSSNDEDGVAKAIDKFVLNHHLRSEQRDPDALGKLYRN